MYVLQQRCKCDTTGHQAYGASGQEVRPVGSSSLPKTLTSIVVVVASMARAEKIGSIGICKLTSGKMQSPYCPRHLPCDAGRSCEYDLGLSCLGEVLSRLGGALGKKPAVQ